MEFDFSIIYQRFQDLAAFSIRQAPVYALALLSFILFLLIARWAKVLVQGLHLPKRHKNLAMVLGRLAQWAVILIGLLVSVTIAFPSFTPANLISALGITGIAVGFAFRDIFQNFLAGILILINEPFRIDDQIVFGNYEGTVENIETRATMLRTYDGRRVVIPNAELFKNSVVVNTAFAARRIEYDVGIGYGDDIDRAKAIMLQTLESIDDVLRDPAPDALTLQFGASSVNIRLRWWIHPPRRADALEITDQVLTSVKKALMSQGIDLPFPTQHILFHDQTEDCDGDRTRQREGWPAGQHTAPRTSKIADAVRDLNKAR